MPVPLSEHVRALGGIRPGEGDFLQALVTDFTVTTSRSGATLSLTLSHDDAAIFSLEGKRALREHVRGRARELDGLRRRLDRCLAGAVVDREERYEFHEPELPFRYGSGGILPIARVAGVDHYVLFWRDIHPIGWNIANGGTESVEEMLDPSLVIAREFHEELVIASPVTRCFRAVGSEGETPAPPAAGARSGTLSSVLDRWRGALGASEWIEAEPAPAAWRAGPDRVRVTLGPRHRETSGYFLNINGEDLGIEVDRVATFELGDDEILLDGELRSDRLLDRLVGLFDRQEVDRMVRDGQAREFHPRMVFLSGRRYDGGELLERLDGGFLPRVRGMRTTDVDRVTGAHLDLCPVTRRVIERVTA